MYESLPYCRAGRLNISSPFIICIICIVSGIYLGAALHNLYNLRQPCLRRAYRDPVVLRLTLESLSLALRSFFMIMKVMYTLENVEI